MFTDGCDFWGDLFKTGGLLKHDKRTVFRQAQENDGGEMSTGIQGESHQMVL